MKKVIATLLTMVMMLSLVGCASEPEAFEITVLLPNGTPALSMVKLIEEKTVITDYVTVNYETTETTDVLSAKLISGEVDMAVIPTNLAANLKIKGAEITLAGPAVWGVFYLVSSEEVTGWEDLKDKEISMFGRGLTADATFRYLMINNGITPDEEVTFNYFAGSTELAADFIAGQSNYAIIPEPLLTNVLMKRTDAKVVMDLQAQWAEVTGLENYPQASLVVQNALIESNPEVVEEFLKAYDKATTWINENPNEAGAYYENLGIGLNAAIVAKSMPGSNIDFVYAEDAIAELEAYLQVLYDFNPALIGGEMPDEGFYYKQ